MKIIVCLSDGMGMMFNKRRQSRDSAVIRDVLAYTDGRVIIDAYSKVLFRGRATVAENLLEEAGDDDYCFVENKAVGKYADRIDEVVIYRWNRKYPTDTYFDLSLGSFVCEDKTEFEGTSHEVITREVWKLDREK